MKVIKLTKGYEALVDDEDFEWLNSRRWYAADHKSRQCSASGCRKVDGKWRTIQMHREIMECPDGMEVDHIDGNALNNQKSNLRICTRGQNACNRKTSKSSLLGYKGTVIDKRGYISAHIQHKRKIYFLGDFKTPEEAARAYDVAAKKIHGKFARLNFPEEA